MKNQEITPNKIVIAPSIIYENKPFDVNNIKPTHENPSPRWDTLFSAQKRQNVSKDGAETSN
jgi:hypothetical protein